MSGLDHGAQRFLLWQVLAFGICLGIYLPQLAALSANLGGLIEETFGTVYSVLPFASLLVLIFALRWGDLHRLLAGENGFASLPRVRALGGLLIVAPFFLQLLVGGMADPLGYAAIELGGVTIVLVFYGTSLLLNPKTLRFMFPYAAVYLAGIVAPLELQSMFGEPLAGFSSFLSSWIVRLVGVPVAWQGVSFSLASRVGGTQISGIVTPGCSSIYSITTFLGLLGLMYVDFRKPNAFTLKVAFVGVLVLVLLNALRISLLIWVGYAFGLDSFTGLHNWVGYAIFLGFYVVLLRVYSTSGGQRGRNVSAIESSIKHTVQPNRPV